MIQATTLMNICTIILNEINHSKKHHIHSYSFHILHELSITRRGKCIEIERRLIIAMVWGVGGKWQVTANGYISMYGVMNMY